jgi:hypothetical protein
VSSSSSHDKLTSTAIASASLPGPSSVTNNPPQQFGSSQRITLSDHNNQPDELVDFGSIDDDEEVNHNATIDHTIDTNQQQGTYANQDQMPSRPSAEDLLISLHLHQYVFLQEAVPTLRFIPDKVLKQVRSVYIKQMQTILRDSTNLQSWSKFLLLTIVLFSLPGKQDDSTQSTKDRILEIKRKLTLLEADDWSQFTFGSLPKRRPITSRVMSDAKQEALRQSKIEQMAHAGEFSKAMTRLTSKTGIPTPSDMVVEALHLLHPEKTENLLHDMLHCHEVLVDSSIHVFDIQGAKLRME